MYLVVEGVHIYAQNSLTYLETFSTTRRPWTTYASEIMQMAWRSGTGEMYNTDNPKAHKRSSTVLNWCYAMRYSSYIKHVGKTQENNGH